MTWKLLGPSVRRPPEFDGPPSPGRVKALRRKGNHADFHRPGRSGWGGTLSRENRR